MKNFTLTFLAMLLTVFYLAGQMPRELSLQSTIRDKNGQIIPKQTVTIKITIREAGINGSVVYTELHNPVTDEQGMVNLVVGQGSLLTGDYSSIDPARCHIIKTTCNTPQGTACVLYGTSQVLSYRYSTAVPADNTAIDDLSLVDNMYETAGMMILAPPDRTEEWMFETTKIDPSEKP
jgi:hypothetical protein